MKKKNKSNNILDQIVFYNIHCSLSKQDLLPLAIEDDLACLQLLMAIDNCRIHPRMCVISPSKFPQSAMIRANTIRSEEATRHK